MEDGEDLNEDVRVEVREVVPDVFKDGKHYVQAEKGYSCKYIKCLAALQTRSAISE